VKLPPLEFLKDSLIMFIFVTQASLLFVLRDYLGPLFIIGLTINIWGCTIALLGRTTIRQTAMFVSKRDIDQAYEAYKLDEEEAKWKL